MAITYRSIIITSLEGENRYLTSGEICHIARSRGQDIASSDKLDYRAREMVAQGILESRVTGRGQTLGFKLI